MSVTKIDADIETRKMLKRRWDTNPVQHYSPNADEPLLFWGGEFSNFVGPPMLMIHPWTGQPEEYMTVEHYFQANKATDIEAHETIRLAGGPGTAKFIGNSIKLRDDWEEVKYSVMLEALKVKFTSTPEWERVLDSTGDRYIAEESPEDAIWGIYDAESDDYTGANMLGLALMEVREWLRDRG